MIAGGGTGGHLFPGVAVAEEIAARDSEATVQFVGTARGIEARVLPELGWDLQLIEVSGIKTVGFLGAIRGMFSVPRALWQSRKLLKKFSPDAVLGVGGYASGPVVLMARLMGIRTAILEQNSIPGLTNKILGRFAHRIFLAFDETRKFFKAKKIAMSGNPIRADIRARLTAGDQRADDSGDRPLRLFVFGGSQGAVAVNELVCGAAALLAERGVALEIVHQTGERDLEATEKRYADAGIKADVRAFINDMATEYHSSDLVISRSGATTIAELGVVGKPAILIPYPFAADNHQVTNAAEMAAGGAALVFEQSETTAESLADAIAELAADPERRRRMGDAMKALGHPEASAAIADWLEGKPSS